MFLLSGQVLIISLQDMLAKEKAEVGDRLLEYWTTNDHDFVKYICSRCVKYFFISKKYIKIISFKYFIFLILTYQDN